MKAATQNFSLESICSFLTITLPIPSPVQGKMNERLCGALLPVGAKPIHFPVADIFCLRILPVSKYLSLNAAYLTI